MLCLVPLVKISFRARGSFKERLFGFLLLDLLSSAKKAERKLRNEYGVNSRVCEEH